MAATPNDPSGRAVVWFTVNQNDVFMAPRPHLRGISDSGSTTRPSLVPPLCWWQNRARSYKSLNCTGVWMAKWSSSPSTLLRTASSDAVGAFAPAQMTGVLGKKVLSGPASLLFAATSCIFFLHIFCVLIAITGGLLISTLATSTCTKEIYQSATNKLYSRC